MFADMVQTLDPGLRLVIVELRGCGESWPPTLNASIELFAEDVLRVVDALKLTRFYIGGHSIGGMIPIEAAKRRNNKKLLDFIEDYRISDIVVAINGKRDQRRDLPNHFGCPGTRR